MHRKGIPSNNILKTRNIIKIFKENFIITYSVHKAVTLGKFKFRVCFRIACPLFCSVSFILCAVAQIFSL